ncbi:MAG TPA: SDR family NAD(P)-dependent oxidoreductase, partial [Chitinophagaceae bacterium]
MKVNELFNLTGKKAVVTGCSRGIGQAMAIALAEAGADVIGIATSMQAGSETGKRVQDIGRSFTGYNTNLSNRTEI